MDSHEQPDEEPADSGGPIAPQMPKGRRSFLRVHRELTDEDLATTAVQKLLIDELERLEADNTSLKSYEDKYHEANKRVGILEEKLKKNVSHDVIFAAMLTIGAALLSYAASIWSDQPTSIIILVCGVVLLIGGITSKLVLK